METVTLTKESVLDILKTAGSKTKRNSQLLWVIN
jgi:hypothetical protein